MDERVKGRTDTGFEFDIPRTVLDDVEVVEAVVELEEKGDPTAITTLCNKLLGTDGKKRLYKHVKQEDGRIPIEATIKEVAEILKAFGKAGKNS